MCLPKKIDDGQENEVLNISSSFIILLVDISSVELHIHAPIQISLFSVFRAWYLCRWTDDLWLPVLSTVCFQLHFMLFCLSTFPIFSLYPCFTKLMYIPLLKICSYGILCNLLYETLASDLSLWK